MEDTPDSKSGAVMRAGSNPALATQWSVAQWQRNRLLTDGL